MGDVAARVMHRGRIARRPRGAAARAVLAAAVVGCARVVPAPAPAPSAPTARDLLARALDSLTGTPSFANALWGVLVVHPGTGDTLYARNADRLFVPASNQKLVTGAVALAQLGPEFRIRTAVLARGPVRDGTLAGDLVLVGRGDPSWSDAMQGDALAPLRDLADSVARRGIRRVTGRVVVATGWFAGPRLGFGWDHDDLGFAYAAPVDAVLLNEGLARVVVTGAPTAGGPADVAAEPIPDAVPMRPALAPTAPAGDTTAVPDAAWDDDARSYRVSGRVAAGRRVAVRVALRDPARAVAAAWGRALADRGIALAGGATADTARALLAGDTLAVHASPPLADVLRYFEKPSQNQIGEQLLRVLGLERTGVGHADSGLAVVRRQLAAWGVDSAMAVPRDGSGLSRHNFVSPRALVRVLDAMHRGPQARIFRDALPVAGVDGTLSGRMQGTPAQGMVSAKTGYVDRVRNLSGYVTTLNGETLLFSALCNNWTVPVRDVERVQDELAARLAAMRYRPPDGAGTPGAR